LSKKRHYYGHKQENEAIKLADSLNEFEKFRELLPAQLRKDLLAGLTAKQIYKKYAPMAAARAVAVALSEADSAKALSAAKEVMDQAEGKVTVRTEVTHKMDGMPEEQLDALIRSRMSSTAEEAEDSQTDDDEGLH
jgi:hypothetical protein